MEEVGRDVWLLLWLLWRPQVRRHFGREASVAERGRVKQELEEGEGEVVGEEEEEAAL